ncbi:MAG TPA: cation:dicarboxylase symporter family transporter [Gemmatimonadales bacterium]|nr:cation:dicarboxylase symporter family transporter [Gemmatimonadales bacterium]
MRSHLWMMGPDRIADMFRTMTNVTGHLATAVVVAPRERAP